ncbi:MAG TPA: coenzyme F420-0:L-glutamate ligase [Kineosporiaceae bacterium]|nr:coenzyme F420-0:L-glutamate ligase [Kineosporiaceae bacterium]
MSHPLPRLEAFGVPGIGEVAAGDDVAALLLAALAAAGQDLADGDIVVVSSKVLSKAEGRSRAAGSRDGAIAEETVRVVAERITPRGTARIVQARSGPVLAAAGVDASNVAPGTVLTLPADPDASARALVTALRERTGCRVGVIVADTLGRPWRQGQTDTAIGAAGVAVVDDLRGGTDAYGNPLEVTVRALADELAGLADLVKGKLTGIPVAVVRGLGELVGDGPGPGAAGLLRSADQDWFRYGHVEAVRAALGVPPGEGPVPPRPVEPGGTGERVERALAVVRAGGDGLPGPAPRIEVERGDGDGDGDTGPDDGRAGLGVLLCSGAPDGSDPAGLVALGMTVQRLLTAAWAEDLDAAVAPPGPGVASPGTIRVRVRPRG